MADPLYEISNSIAEVIGENLFFDTSKLLSPKCLCFFIYHDMIFVIASWSAPIESLYSRQFGRKSLWQKIRNDATNIIIICK